MSKIKLTEFERNAGSFVSGISIPSAQSARIVSHLFSCIEAERRASVDSFAHAVIYEALYQIIENSDSVKLFERFCEVVSDARE